MFVIYLVVVDAIDVVAYYFHSTTSGHDLLQSDRLTEQYSRSIGR